MKILDQEFVNGTLKRVEQKGPRLVLAGTTGSGKSTIITESTKNEGISEMLELREADGKGSTAITQITFTDDDAIPEDVLFFNASIVRLSNATIGDDNVFLGNLLFDACQTALKTPEANRKAAFSKKVSSEYHSQLENSSNTSLPYKISRLTEEGINGILDIILGFPVDRLLSNYQEVKVKHPREDATARQAFREIFSGDPETNAQIEQFWNVVLKFLKQSVEELCEEVKNAGGIVDENEDGFYRIRAALTVEDKESSLTTKLLCSENGSEEYLFADISLVTRGADFLFNSPNAECLTVAEHDGTEIHCVQFIDTQGLFHETDAKIENEQVRIIDLLSAFHTSHLLLVVHSRKYDTAKDGIQVISQFLRQANRNINVYTVYTHWDEFLQQNATTHSVTSRRNRAISINWEQQFVKADVEQCQVAEQFSNSLLQNDSKRKPVIVGKYRTAFPVDEKNPMKVVLDANHINYHDALKDFMRDFTVKQVENGARCRVMEGIENCANIDPKMIGISSIKALFENLVLCKDKKLYAATVRACMRKWQEFGNPHHSEVYSNPNGFENIETDFVREIRNYTQNILVAVHFQVKDYLVKPEDEDLFLKQLKDYLQLNQNLGRKVTQKIGVEAYRHGFEMHKGFAYQYTLFSEAIEYTRRTYFPFSSIPFGKDFQNIFEEALHECVADFVDAYCVVLY